ncbi:D-lactaldehyde dehydrogenase [Roridomyces roridus]|uniref:D-lactaldehyde dehydrogenase n=1 Tax=Roridomyces roridus TaxID=1738132 RepID=A0AAD7BBN0_9AGAR|nr:D-lactaldehyde dehydrogenase [Roridomyces roridus]
MPIVHVGKVLVSGTNGYVAVWVVRKLLESGFSVRGTVRSADKGQHLTELFKSYGDKFELIVVPDIAAEGAFDEAVKGVDAIAHTASPFHFNAHDPAELSVPAIQGTVGILESARKYGQSVKRVVITGSTASIIRPKTEQLDEFDWNEPAVKAVEERGSEATNAEKYQSSKTLAERAAWKFLDDHIKELGWDLAVMNPPFVLGPPIHELSSSPAAAALNTSTKVMLDVMTIPDAAARLNNGNFVDVRDLGDAHVRAFKSELPAYVPMDAVNKEEGKNVNRFIIGGFNFTWQDWLDALPPTSKAQKGTPGSGTRKLDYSNAKAKKVLGLGAEGHAYIPFVQTARDTLADFEKRGWVESS